MSTLSAFFCLFFAFCLFLSFKVSMKYFYQAIIDVCNSIYSISTSTHVFIIRHCYFITANVFMQNILSSLHTVTHKLMWRNWQHLLLNLYTHQPLDPEMPVVNLPINIRPFCKILSAKRANLPKNDVYRQISHLFWITSTSN